MPSSTPFPFTFDRLESLEIVVDEYFVNMFYHQLLVENAGIKTLTYRRGLTRYNSIVKYLHLLPELKELTCRWWPDDEEFDKFPWTQLDRATFVVKSRRMHEAWNVAELLRLVPTDWKVVATWEKEFVEGSLRYPLYHVALERIGELQKSTK